jgi:hypothetical protein
VKTLKTRRICKKSSLRHKAAKRDFFSTYRKSFLQHFQLKSFKHYGISQDFVKGFLVSSLIGFILLYSVFPYGPVSAATYTFTQTSWLGGATANNAVHASNQSGWTEYSAKDSGLSVVNAGADLQLGTTSATVVQTNEGATNTGFNLAGYSHAATQVTGTGSSASVQLTSTGVVAWQTPATLDSTGLVGSFASLAIGLDGFARITYFDSSNTDIKFVQCTNASCSSNNITIIDATVTTGHFIPIAIASDGFARISYYSGAYLKFVQCTNDACSAKSTVTVDSTVAVVGQYAALAIGSDGFARISYFDSSNSALKYAQCTSASCSAKSLTTLDATGIVGEYTSIAIGADGFARISYFDNTNGDLKFAQCNDDACSAPAITAVDQAAGTMGKWSSIGIGADGFARISYYGGNDLKFIQCTDAACTTPTMTTVDATGTVGEYTSLKVASDGFARISYYDGTNGNLKFAKCTNAACSTSTISVLDSTGVTGQYTSLGLGSDGLAKIAYYDVSNIDLRFAFESTSYNTPGTFVSGPINLSSGVTWGNLSWTATGGQTITLKARSDADGNFADATAWASCSSVTSGNALSTGGCVTNGQQYIQYEASLSTADNTITPSLDDVTIGYSSYSSSASLTASAYDSGDAINVVGGLSWSEDATLPSNTTVAVSLRTAASVDGLTGSWTDFTNGTASCSKVTGTVTCSSSAIPAGMKDGLSDRWVQYKVTLATSDGVSTPTVGQVVVTYVVNAPPQFDTTFNTNGLSVSQITDSGDANWGKVQIQYKVRDSDTTTGTASPNEVTPTFEYNIGGGWLSITSGYLSTGATTNKAVEEVAYTIYTAYWDAASQIIGGTDTASAQVRVTINDNEAANNTATATETTITIDTTDPTVSTFTMNSTTDTVTIAASDTNNLQYRLSNNEDMSADGLNATSGQWQTVGATTLSSSPAWVFTGAPSYEVVYIVVRDTYGNTTATSAKAPNASNSIDIKDVSNASTAEYREFISWTVYTPANNAAFASYKIYRSTNGSTYSLLTTISDVATNYYADSTVSTGTTYYYKVQVVDSNGDISGFSAAVSDDPDGQGGTDVTAPTISAVTAATVQATWAKITWTTDELANSFVDYSVSPSTAFGTTTPVTSMATSHTVTLTGLIPSTTYLYRVRSADIFSNSASDDNTAAGYSFTTLAGTIISDVTTESVTETTAVIVWNTNSDSNSYVDYAATTSALDSGVGVTEVGVSTLVGSVNNGLYQHRVTVTGLTQRTDYYYYVKSTDSNANTATDTNSSTYYTFTTTYDNQPPVISGIATPVLTSSIAVVTWNTDELANAQVQYGSSTGVYGSSTVLDATLSISHAVTITGLTKSTTYYYRIITADAKGNSVTSDEQTFATTAPEAAAVTGGGGCYTTLVDSTPPGVSNIETSDIGMFDAKVTFATSESTVGFILFGETESYGYTIASSDFAVTHTFSVFGLKPGYTYHFRAKAIDKSGNTTTSATDQVFTTITSQPVIKSVELTQANAFDAIVQIATDVPTRVFVRYGENEEYENTAGSSVLATSHLVKLVGLKLGTNYHFKADALDAYGVLTSGEDQKFITKFIAEAGELVTVKKIEQFQENLEELISSIAPSIKPPLVTDVKIEDITTDSAVVTWRTNIKTSSMVAIASASEYKPAEGSSYQTEIGNAGERTTEHSVALSNLLPDTLYHIQAKSQSIVSIIGKSDDLTFVTKAQKIEAKVASVELDTIRVIWTTVEPASSVVEYKNIKTGATGQKIDITNTKYHDVLLDHLDANTTYSINASGRNERGNSIESSRNLFVATSTDSTAPVITNLKINSALMPGRNDKVQTVVTWVTDEPATSVVEYVDGSSSAKDKPGNTIDTGDQFTTSHSVITNVFKPGSLYRLRIRSSDAYNNTATTPNRTIITPQKTESILDVIVNNFQESFGFLRR